MVKKNRLIMQVTLLLIPMFVVAQYDHISVFSHLNGDDLYEEVVDTYKPDVVLTYGMARDTMFSKIDVVNDSLECIYTGMKRYLTPGEDPTQAVYLDGAPNGINTEHSYPQSKGASDGNARSDMHHLYPTRSQTNNDRGSKVFDESNDFQTLIWYRNTTEQGNTPGASIDEWSELGNNLFEPRESVKGDIARSIMYFYTMYRDQANAADPDFFGLQQEILCDWHYEDPVDQVEWERSHKIAQWQEGKANPFVLDCSLAARVYCNQVSAECMLVDVDDVITDLIHVYPNPAQEFLYIDGVSDSKISISSVNGKVSLFMIRNGKVDISSLVKGIYFLSLELNGNDHSLTFVKM